MSELKYAFKVVKNPNHKYAPGATVAVVDNEGYSAFSALDGATHISPDDLKECLARANIFAAAPDMLEALIVAEKIITANGAIKDKELKHEPLFIAVVGMRNAIAKARGKK